jgi:Ulp1 family protease
MSVNVEATAVKDTSESIFQFTAGNTPLQKLHQILNDPRVSPDNPKCSEIAHFVDEQGKNYGITYIEFLRHRNNEYMGCEVINGFMFLLREQFNNGGKNRFFPTQFFPAIFDEKISRSKQGEQSKLTNFVNSNKDEWKNNWEELYFPINVHDNHWILILVDKPAKAVVVFDSIANINQYHVNKIFDLVKLMEDSTTTWSTIDNSQNNHIQRQKDRVNCGYFTCWYARQLAMNESVDKFDGEYEAVIQDIREDIMCSIIKRRIIIGDDKQKIYKLTRIMNNIKNY